MFNNVMLFDFIFDTLRKVINVLSTDMVFFGVSWLVVILVVYLATWIVIIQRWLLTPFISSVNPSSNYIKRSKIKTHKDTRNSKTIKINFKN